MSILGVQSIHNPAAGIVDKAKGATTDPTAGFGEILNKAVTSVNNNMQEAEALTVGLVSGEHSNIHETMIAMEKANISFRLLTKVQSKVISAYEEIIRMQL